MIRLVHGLMYPTVSRCQIDTCYLGRTLRGVRLETGTFMMFRTADRGSHELRSKLSPEQQRADLVDILGADGWNVVRFDVRGVMVVSPREGT